MALKTAKMKEEAERLEAEAAAMKLKKEEMQAAARQKLEERERRLAKEAEAEHARRQEAPCWAVNYLRWGIWSLGRSLLHARAHSLTHFPGVVSE
eukprot:15434212-Alexandrium_andersonii.AAC.1